MKILAPLAIIAALMFPAAALAVDFSATITRLDGTVMTTSDTDKTPFTIAAAVENALLIDYRDEQNLSGEDKIKRWRLANKIAAHPVDPDLTPEEIVLIKKLVAKAYNPLVCGEVWKAVDPASVK